MADWDAIGSAPAQVQNPWAVRSMAPAPISGKQKAMDAGNATNPAMDLADVGIRSILNLPHAAAHGILDILRGATGQDTNAPDPAIIQKMSVQPTAQENQTISNVAGSAPVQGAMNAVGPAIDAAIGGVQKADTALGNASPTLQDILHRSLQVGGDVGAAVPMVGGAIGATSKIGDALSASRVAAEAAMSPAETLGMRTAENSPIARSIAGPSGREALNLQNHQVGNAAAGADAGVPHGTDLGYGTLEAAREAPNAVYGRVAAALPTAPLSPGASAAVRAAGGANRITEGTPDAIANISALKNKLLEPGKAFTGDQIINESRGLRQEGGANTASDDVSNQQLGEAQLDMAHALEDHVAATLPPNADVDLPQFQAARTALAKNYAVQSALRGPNVDLQALARVQRGSPQLLTGNLKTLADFANDHPEVSTLPSASARYAPPGLGKDLGQLNIINPRSWMQPLLGTLARRSLTGSPEAAAAAARSAPVTGLGGEFDPLPMNSLHTPGEVGPAPSRQTPLPLGPEGSGQVVNPTGGLTASPPTGAPPAAAGSPGQIPLADLLSHGVEQPPPAELSSAPMGAPAQTGMPFARDAGHEAGDLSLADAWASPTDMSLLPAERAAVRERTAAQRTGGDAEPQPELIPRRAAEHEGEVARRNNQDLASVMSQGVPEGIMARTSPRFSANNASGQTPVSEEFANAQNADRAQGVTRSIITPDGQGTPVSGVAARDLGVQGSSAGAPVPKGHLAVEEKPGEAPRILDRGGLSQGAAQGLLNRWLALRKPLGDIDF